MVMLSKHFSEALISDSHNENDLIGRTWSIALRAKSFLINNTLLQAWSSLLRYHGHMQSVMEHWDDCSDFYLLLSQSYDHSRRNMMASLSSLLWIDNDDDTLEWLLCIILFRNAYRKWVLLMCFCENPIQLIPAFQK